MFGRVLGAAADSLRRSINLALSYRGLQALERAGVRERVLEESVSMSQRVLHKKDGSLGTQAYGTHGECIYSVSRRSLSAAMLDALERTAAATLLFESEVTKVLLEDGGVRVTIESESSSSSSSSSSSGERGEGAGGAGGALGPGRGVRRRQEVSARCVIGADGAFSKMREVLLRQSPADFSRSFMARVYKELDMPPVGAGDFALPMPHGLHIWGRDETMLIALPNVDRSFTCTLFTPRERMVELDRLDDRALEEWFQLEFPDAVPHLPALVRQFRTNPWGSLLTVRVNPWNIDSRLLLVGDAAHAVVPFYGQGMNAAFEDALVLLEALDRERGDWDRAVPAFAALRRVQTDALADLSIENDLEMRQKTFTMSFLLQKRLEALLHHLFPNWWIPQYSMVSFTRIPYDQVRARAQRQDRAIHSAAWYASVAVGACVITALLALLAARARAARLRLVRY